MKAAILEFRSARRPAIIASDRAVTDAAHPATHKLACHWTLDADGRLAAHWETDIAACRR